MYNLTPVEFGMLRTVLARVVPDCEVRIFGSRVSGTAQRFSDIDLALVGNRPVDWRRIERLKDALSESDLPYLVDVVDWKSVSNEFKKIIGAHSEVIQTPREKAS